MLNTFIIGYATLIHWYKSIGDLELDQHILERIPDKLKGKAEFIIRNRTKLNNWDSSYFFNLLNYNLIYYSQFNRE